MSIIVQKDATIYSLQEYSKLYIVASCWTIIDSDYCSLYSVCVCVYIYIYIYIYIRVSNLSVIFINSLCLPSASTLLLQDSRSYSNLVNSVLQKTRYNIEIPVQCFCGVTTESFTLKREQDICISLRCCIVP